MKKILSAILALTATVCVSAQSTLTTKDGDVLKVYNVDVSGTAVYYTLTNDHDASIRRMEKIYVDEILTANGDKYDLETGKIVWQPYASRMYTIKDAGIIYIVTIDSLSVNYRMIPDESGEVYSIEKTRVYKIVREDGSVLDFGNMKREPVVQAAPVVVAPAETTTVVTTVTTTSASSDSESGTTTRTRKGLWTTASGEEKSFTMKYKGITGEILLSDTHLGANVDGYWRFIHAGFALYYLYDYDNDYVDSDFNFKIRLGGNLNLGYRPFNFSLSGGLVFTHNTVNFYYDESYKFKQNDIGVYVMPRIMTHLTRHFGLTAAYHCDFRFNDMSDSFDAYPTVGIVIGWF